MADFNRERAAMVLVEAAFHGDRRAAEMGQVSERSIRNWRERMADDSELTALFQQKKRQFEASWANELPIAIRACIAFIVRAAQDGNARDPEMVHAIAGALKIVTDAGFAKAILDVKLSEYGPALVEYGGSVAGQIIETGETD